MCPQDVYLEDRCPGDMGKCDGSIVSKEVVSGGLVCDKAMKIICSKGHVQLRAIFPETLIDFHN